MGCRDTNFDAQQSNNVMVQALRRQMKWLTFGNEGLPLQRLNPLRPLVHAYNAFLMDRYISSKLDSRFATHQDKDNAEDLKRSKCVIDLALTAHLEGRDGKQATQGMDGAFKGLAMSQIKLFLFSGHDTTSSSICYILYLLSIHPTVLERVRTEHGQVFGSDLAATTITKNPYLLNQLPYTVAVIKESTRLFPAASTTRSGEPGFYITDQGRRYPTNGHLVYLISQAIHRDPAYWPHPDKFLPKRWLTSPGDPLYPIKGAWRPFEHGPRSCIGLELAMIEMKIVMILTLREFNIHAMYEELDKLTPRKGPQTVDGERAYQIGLGQPSGNLPCRVSLAVK